MTAAPEASEDNNDLLLWNQLLADALAVSVQVKQNQGVQSENMRNYSYQLRDYAYTWALLAEKSDDLLKKFYNCGTGITFQRDDASHIYGHSYPCGGCGNCDECI